MEIRQRAYGDGQSIETIPGRMGRVQACRTEPGGPITSLIIHVSSSGKPTLPICLEGDAPLELLNLLLAARDRCPELFKE